MEDHDGDEEDTGTAEVEVTHEDSRASAIQPSSVRALQHEAYLPPNEEVYTDSVD